MRRWIAGLDPRAALPIAVVCNILVLLLGAAIATVVVARAQEPTNGSAGMIPAAAAVCFVAIVVVLWYLAQGGTPGPVSLQACSASSLWSQASLLKPYRWDTKPPSSDCVVGW